MNRIVLYRDPAMRTWMMRFEGPHADGIKGLYGTNAISAGFSDLACANTVLVGIKRLNPHCELTIEGTP